VTITSGAAGPAGGALREQAVRVDPAISKAATNAATRGINPRALLSSISLRLFTIPLIE